MNIISPDHEALLRGGEGTLEGACRLASRD